MQNNYYINYISLLIALTIFMYVYKLEQDKCECSKDWRRDFIKVFSGIIIVLSSAFSVINCSGIKLSSALSKLVEVIAMITGMASIVYLYSLFTYSRDLIEKKCECSDKWQRLFMYYYSIIVVVLIAIMMLSLLTLLLQSKKVSKKSVSIKKA